MQKKYNRKNKRNVTHKKENILITLKYTRLLVMCARERDSESKQQEEKGEFLLENKSNNKEQQWLDHHNRIRRKGCVLGCSC